MDLTTSDFRAPSDWISIRSIDMHTGGEPLRVILDGFPKLEGDGVLAYRRFIQNTYDSLRTTLMFEPRGHADMYGVVVTPSEQADFGVVFMHNEGYSTMCGHATIAIAKLAVEMNWAKKVEPVTTMTIEAPCGLLQAFVSVDNGEVTAVRFQNVPSFVVALDQVVTVPGLGPVEYDLAYGGAFYAFVKAASVGLTCDPSDYTQLIKTGMDIKRAIMTERAVRHPLEEDLSFLYGTIFIGDPVASDRHSRNVCVFAEGEVDRSPTGSGVSARAAIHHQRGELAVGESITIESILGTTFDVKICEEVTYEGLQAVVPEVTGTAYVTGKNEFLIDPSDPLKDGFILR